MLGDPRRRHRYWLHALLLLVTLLTTTVAGSDLARNFAQNRPFQVDDDWFGYVRIWHHPSELVAGLPFSLSLLGILMAHEMGHYLTALYWGVDTTLPFFLPAPTLIGTFGAFIRIRSPIRTKRSLFDIGIAGPIAGFVVLVVVLMVGISLSKVIPGAGLQGDLVFGVPLLFRCFAWVKFPQAQVTDILVHPVARAAWVGMLTTALNLLPIGQLDGGHILYAFWGERTRLLSRIFVGTLVLLGAYQLWSTHYRTGASWLVWAAMLFFLALRHPVIYDSERIGPGRKWMGFAALLILILSFMMTPVRT